MKSSSIGSPLLNTIRAGAFQSSSQRLNQLSTQKACAVLSVLSPRLFPALLIRLFESDVTVRVCLSPAMSGGSGEPITSSTTAGRERWMRQIASSKAAAFLRYPLPETVQVRTWPTPGDLVCHTEYRIRGGFKPRDVTGESCWIAPSTLWPLLNGFPLKNLGSRGREFRVWTSPLTFARGRTRKPGLSSGG